MKIFFSNWLYKKNQSGQALVTLLVFVAIATTVIAAATAVTILNIQSSSKFSMGTSALDVAEAGAEEALIRLLRNPSYSGNSNFTVGDYSANIQISGTNPITITSIGNVNPIQRTVQIVVDYTGGQFTISSWQEVD